MGRSKSRHQPSGASIVYEDRDLLVIDKAPGILTMGTDRREERTVYRALTDYVRKGNAKSRHRIFIVHRLDRETSGLLIFARSPAAQQTLTERWEDLHKVYTAVVHGQPPEEEGTLVSHLAENKAHRVFVTDDARAGYLARTSYKVLKQGPLSCLLDIDLLTGRKHQIRVQLAALGHPVVGDRKYGKPGDGVKRLALHARSITFPHPHSGALMTVESPVPALFERLLNVAV